MGLTQKAQDSWLYSTLIINQRISTSPKISGKFAVNQ